MTIFCNLYGSHPNQLRAIKIKIDSTGDKIDPVITGKNVLMSLNYSSFIYISMSTL